jgi:hypothetical protein
VTAVTGGGKAEEEGEAAVALGAKEEREREVGGRRAALGTQFTCFTSTNTDAKGGGSASGRRKEGGVPAAEATPSTKVQILT